MTLRKEVEQGNRIIREQAEKIAELKECIRELKEELNYYRTAMSAVKWLWDKAVQISEKNPFQL